MYNFCTEIFKTRTCLLKAKINCLFIYCSLDFEAFSGIMFYFIIQVHVKVNFLSAHNHISV